MGLTKEQQEGLDGMVDFFHYGVRSPVYRRPDEVGLDYEDVFFQSLDGVPLEGWFIPKKGSLKLIICNHFMPGNRYGYAGHLPGYGNFGGFEVNFLHHYKHLHDAGYNILAYDLRNHGLSGSSLGGSCTIGLHECRDVVGSIQYAKSRQETKDMTIGLLSICLGCDSTMVAMKKWPEHFKDIRAMVGLQPISITPFIQKNAELMGVGLDSIGEAEKYFTDQLRARNGFRLEEFTPIPYAKYVKIPTKIVQVHDDFRTKPEDVQAIYDNLGTKEKELFWIENEKERFQGYNYFGKDPKEMLDWFAKYM